MSQKVKITRRDFLRMAGLSSLSAALAACGTKVVKETQIVQQTVAPQIVKETVAPEVVQQTVVVKETSVVTQEVVREVTATPPPALKEAPMLAEMVAAGKLPPLEQRLPADPLVIPPLSEVGQFGGTVHLYSPDTMTFDEFQWVREANWLKPAAYSWWDKGEKGYVSHRAKSVTSNDNMTEFVVTLRKGMKWSDGEPVTADDVMFTVNDVVAYPDLKDFHWSWGPGVYPTNFPTVTKVDDFTIKFVFKEPQASFLGDNTGWMSNQGLGLGEQPFHYLKQFHLKYNPDADTQAKDAGYENWQKWFRAMSKIGTDQINVDLPTINMWYLKIHTDTQNVYERNAYYWAVDTQGNQLPYIDGIIVDAVSDIEVAKLKMIAGDFDLAGGFLMSLQDYPMLKKNEQNGKYLIILNRGNTATHPVICPNLNHKDLVLRKIMQEPDFHKALAYAMNRDEINQICFVGLGVGRQAVYFSWDYLDPGKWSSAYTEFNPDKAKELLDGLGLKKDAKGNYLRPDGKPLTLNLETIVEHGWAPQVELIAKHWSDIGIPCQYSPIARDLWGQKNDANELDMFIWSDGGYNELGYLTSPNYWNFREHAWYWYYWLELKGQHPEEEEPPAEFKSYWDDVQALAKTTYGSDEYKALAEKLWNFRLEKLWTLGTVGDFPTPLLAKYDIGNIGNTDIPFSFWQGQYPEQFYWKDPVRIAEKVP